MKFTNLVSVNSSGELVTWRLWISVFTLTNHICLKDICHGIWTIPVLVLGQLWLTFLIHFTCWLL